MITRYRYSTKMVFLLSLLYFNNKVIIYFLGTLWYDHEPKNICRKLYSVLTADLYTKQNILEN
jgi:hypothetical protein